MAPPSQAADFRRATGRRGGLRQASGMPCHLRARVCCAWHTHRLATPLVVSPQLGRQPCGSIGDGGTRHGSITWSAAHAPRRPSQTSGGSAIGKKSWRDRQRHGWGTSHGRAGGNAGCWSGVQPRQTPPPGTCAGSAGTADIRDRKLGEPWHKTGPPGRRRRQHMRPTCCHC